MTTDTVPEPTRVAEAKSLVLRGEARAAVGLLREHLAEEPNDARAWHRLAGALIGDDRPDEALTAASRAVELAPTLAVAHRFVALAHVFNGDRREGLAAVTRAVELDPDDAEAQALRAECLLVTGAPLADVSAALSRASELEPDRRLVRSVRRRLRATRFLPLGRTLLTGAAGAAMALGLLILLVGAAPDTRPVLPIAATSCVLVAAVLWWPVVRAGVIASRRFTLVPVAAAPVVAGGTVTAVVAEAGGTQRSAVAFGLIAAVLTAMIAIRARQLG